MTLDMNPHQPSFVRLQESARTTSMLFPPDPDEGLSQLQANLSQMLDSPSWQQQDRAIHAKLPNDPSFLTDNRLSRGFWNLGGQGGLATKDHGYLLPKPMADWASLQEHRQQSLAGAFTAVTAAAGNHNLEQRQAARDNLLACCARLGPSALQLFVEHYRRSLETLEHFIAHNPQIARKQKTTSRRQCQQLTDLITRAESRIAAQVDPHHSPRFQAMLETMGEARGIKHLLDDAQAATGTGDIEALVLQTELADLRQEINAHRKHFLSFTHSPEIIENYYPSPQQRDQVVAGCPGVVDALAQPQGSAAAPYRELTHWQNVLQKAAAHQLRQWREPTGSGEAGPAPSRHRFWHRTPRQSVVHAPTDFHNPVRAGRQRAFQACLQDPDIRRALDNAQREFQQILQSSGQQRADTIAYLRSLLEEIASIHCLPTDAGADSPDGSSQTSAPADPREATACPSALQEHSDLRRFVDQLELPEKQGLLNSLALQATNLQEIHQTREISGWVNAYPKLMELLFVYGNSLRLGTQYYEQGRIARASDVLSGFAEKQLSVMPRESATGQLDRTEPFWQTFTRDLARHMDLAIRETPQSTPSPLDQLPAKPSKASLRRAQRLVPLLQTMLDEHGDLVTNEPHRAAYSISEFIIFSLRQHFVASTIPAHLLRKHFPIAGSPSEDPKLVDTCRWYLTMRGIAYDDQPAAIRHLQRNRLAGDALVDAYGQVLACITPPLIFGLELAWMAKAPGALAMVCDPIDFVIIAGILAPVLANVKVALDSERIREQREFFERVTAATPRLTDSDRPQLPLRPSVDAKVRTVRSWQDLWQEYVSHPLGHQEHQPAKEYALSTHGESGNRSFRSYHAEVSEVFWALAEESQEAFKEFMALLGAVFYAESSPSSANRP